MFVSLPVRGLPRDYVPYSLHKLIDAEVYDFRSFQ